MIKCKECQDLKTENIKFTLDTKKLIAQYSAKIEVLKQTLAEIKEIAEICKYKNILNVIERTKNE